MGHWRGDQGITARGATTSSQKWSRREDDDEDHGYGG
jgi:hypothetical protein